MSPSPVGNEKADYSRSIASEQGGNKEEGEVAKSKGYTSAEVKAGVFLTLCLVLFCAMLFVYGKASRYWKGREILKVVFTSVTSLRPDAPVRFNGVEVGRVRNIRIIRLTKENLDRLPPMGPNDLDNLPLTPVEHLELKSLGPPPSRREPEKRKAYFDQYNMAVRKLLTDKVRTMIELNLEVLSSSEDEQAEAAGKRYRLDDQVRIRTTLLGDTSVEITSGSGAPMDTAQDHLILGVSGDFFTNLGRSVEQVKEILASVSDVVGTEERQSVRNALKRFDSITEKIENIVNVANSRLDKTWDKIDTLADSAKTDLDAIGETVTELQPKIAGTLTSADEAIQDLQKRLGLLTDEARQAVADIKKELTPILADVHYITDNSKDDFPLLVKNAKELLSRLKFSADKLDGVLNTGNRLLTESYPDMRRLILALRMGSENFEEFTNLIKRKPWLMRGEPPKESDFADAQLAAQSLEKAMKRFRELNTELRAIRRNAPNKPNATHLERLDFLIQELDILTSAVTQAGELMGEKILPPFQRKKGPLVDAGEQE